MTKKSVGNTLKPDIVLNDYWKDNDKFADLVNAVFFNGKPLVKPYDLSSFDSDASLVIEGKKRVNTKKLERDNLKIAKFCDKLKVKFVIYGTENQTDIHYAMPVRVMHYDSSTYYNQYNALKKHYESTKELKGEEFLSGMKKDDRLYPVITIVLYYGEKKWDGAKSIKELLDIPEGLQNFVNDYKMNLIELRDNNLVLNNADNRDLFNLFRLLYDASMTKKERRQKVLEYNDEHKVSTSVALAVASAANSKVSLDKIAQGDGDMCSVFDEIAQENKQLGKEEGKEEGREEGRAAEITEMGIEFGLAENDIVERIISKLKISRDKAQSYYNAYSKNI